MSTDKSHQLLFHWHIAGATEFFREKAAACGGWATAAVLLILALFQLILFLRRRSSASAVAVAGESSPAAESAGFLSTPSSSSQGMAQLITDEDLGELIKELDLSFSEERDNLLDVISKRNDQISYRAWRHKHEEGPPKYLSVTIFQNCSPDLLRDFYMDNEYRREWDNTIVSHDQIQFDSESGIEIGQTVKKFPLLTPREYLLMWRVWEGRESTFYCFIKDCEHPLVPRQKKYVRVGFFRSGWCIRKVPGMDASEIRIVHQESNGMNVEMAKLAFAKGIWSYVCKMDRALRLYNNNNHHHNDNNVSYNYSRSILTMHRLIKKVPPSLETNTEITSQDLSRPSDGTKKDGQLKLIPSKKWIANGLFLVGTVFCLSRGRSHLGAQLAMACILKKITNNNNNNTSSSNDNNCGSNNGRSGSVRGRGSRANNRNSRVRDN